MLTDLGRRVHEAGEGTMGSCGPWLIVAAAGWPMRPFAEQLLLDRGPADEAARLALKPQLFQALGVVEPAPPPQPAPPPEPPPIQEGSFELRPNLPIRDAQDTDSSVTKVTPADVIEAGLWVDIQYTAIGDLSIQLIHNGIKETVHSLIGGYTDDLHRWYRLTKIPGTSLEGVWKLRVHDWIDGNRGTLRHWRVHLKYRLRP